MLVRDCDGVKAIPITPQTMISLGLTITLISVITSMAFAYASSLQSMRDHILDTNIHWTSTSLDKEYITRGEFATYAQATRDDLAEIKEDVKALRKFLLPDGHK